jgi:hypothetical protein
VGDLPQREAGRRIAGSRGGEAELRESKERKRRDCNKCSAQYSQRCH